jgi:hypothetical protein
MVPIAGIICQEKGVRILRQAQDERKKLFIPVRVELVETYELINFFIFSISQQDQSAQLVLQRP